MIKKESLSRRSTREVGHHYVLDSLIVEILRRNFDVCNGFEVLFVTLPWTLSAWESFGG